MLSTKHKDLVSTMTSEIELPALAVSGKLAEHVVRMYGWNESADYDEYSDEYTSISLYKDREQYEYLINQVLSNPGKVENVSVEQPLYDKEYVKAFGNAVGDALTKLLGDRINQTTMGFVQSSVNYAKNWMVYEAFQDRSIFNPWEPILELILLGYMVGGDEEGMHVAHVKQGILF